MQFLCCFLLKGLKGLLVVGQLKVVRKDVLGVGSDVTNNDAARRPSEGGQFRMKLNGGKREWGTHLMCSSETAYFWRASALSKTE